MKCPKCGSAKNTVFDSRTEGNTRMRRRKCLNCGHNYKTYEGYANNVEMRVMRTVADDLVSNIRRAIQKTFDDYRAGLKDN